MNAKIARKVHAATAAVSVVHAPEIVDAPPRVVIRVASAAAHVVDVLAVLSLSRAEARELAARLLAAAEVST